MGKYKSSARLKAEAKQKLLGNYTPLIGAFLISEIIISSLSMIAYVACGHSSVYEVVIYYLIMILLSLFGTIFTSGQIYMYLNISCGRPVTVNDTFHGFSFHPDRAILIELFLMLITTLPALPAAIFFYFWKSGSGSVYVVAFSALICAAIVIMTMLSLTYSQAFYLMYDFPQYSVKQLMHTSRIIMSGNKGRFFYLCVSFIPLILLSMLSFGIGLLWLFPYMCATQTEFFLDIMRNRNS
jgi:uncharacterized membrane protein